MNERANATTIEEIRDVAAGAPQAVDTGTWLTRCHSARCLLSHTLRRIKHKEYRMRRRWRQRHITLATGTAVSSVAVRMNASRDVKSKFHYADFPETSPWAKRDVMGLSRTCGRHGEVGIVESGLQQADECDSVQRIRIKSSPTDKGGSVV